MLCPKCNNNNLDGNVVCQFCGNVLTEQTNNVVNNNVTNPINNSNVQQPVMNNQQFQYQNNYQQANLNQTNVNQIPKVTAMNPKIIPIIIAVVFGFICIYVFIISPAKVTSDNMDKARVKAFVTEVNEITRIARTAYADMTMESKNSISNEVCISYQYMVDKGLIPKKDNSNYTYSGSVLVSVDQDTGKASYKVWFSNGIYKVVTKNDDGSTKDGYDASSYDVSSQNVVKGTKASNNCK